MQLEIAGLKSCLVQGTEERYRNRLCSPCTCEYNSSPVGGSECQSHRIGPTNLVPDQYIMLEFCEVLSPWGAYTLTWSILLKLVMLLLFVRLFGRSWLVHCDKNCCTLEPLDPYLWKSLTRPENKNMGSSCLVARVIANRRHVTIGIQESEWVYNLQLTHYALAARGQLLTVSILAFFPKGPAGPFSPGPSAPSGALGRVSPLAIGARDKTAPNRRIVIFSVTFAVAYNIFQQESRPYFIPLVAVCLPWLSWTVWIFTIISTLRPSEPKELPWFLISTLAQLLLDLLIATGRTNRG